MHAFADADGARDRAFENLYRRYVRDVYRYTLAVLRNPADAEDVTQITFLNAYRAYKRGEEPGKPQHWLIKIAHNACRTRYLRAARRPHEVPLEESAELPGRDGEAPRVTELLAALGKLPFNQRAALVMRELEGRSYAEIAETLDVSVAAVETLIFRARRALRKDRSALQVLGTVQIPPSLVSFFGGGGAIAGGGAAIGSGLLAKAALLFSAAILVGGVAEKTSDAARKRAPAPAAARAPVTAQVAPAGSAGRVLVARSGTATLPAGATGALEIVGGVLVQTGTSIPGAVFVGDGGQATLVSATVAGEAAGSAPASVGAAAVPGAAGPIGVVDATASVAGAASTGLPTPLSSAQPLPAVGTLTSAAPSLPAATAPSAGVPSVAVTSVTAPSASTPSVGPAPVATPSVTTPSVTTPAVTTPPVSVPSVSAPAVTVPTVTAPSVATPSATVPSTPVTPSVTVPSTTVTLPPPPTLP